MASKQEFSSDIKHYLSYDISTHIFDLALEQYDLPKMDVREKSIVQAHYVEAAPEWGKVITSSPESFNRFKKFLTSEFGGKRDEDLLEGITVAGDCNFFAYSKAAVKKNRAVQRALGPKQMEKWVDECATFIDDTLDMIRERERAAEIQELERLAKKHGRKLS